MSNGFKALNISLTGTFNDRDAVIDRIAVLGGVTCLAVTKKTDLLVLGSTPGSKLTKAVSLGVEVLSERLFMEVTAEPKEQGEQNALDVQEGGNHYKTKAIQPWEYIEANNLEYWSGNIVKYITRHMDKGGVDDLKKARHHIDYLIQNYVKRFGGAR